MRSAACSTTASRSSTVRSACTDRRLPCVGTPISMSTSTGEPSFAEMRLLDLYVLHEDRWLLDLTQVTPVFGTVGNPPGE